MLLRRPSFLLDPLPLAHPVAVFSPLRGQGTATASKAIAIATVTVLILQLARRLAFSDVFRRIDRRRIPITGSGPNWAQSERIAGTGRYLRERYAAVRQTINMWSWIIRDWNKSERCPLKANLHGR